MKKAALIITLMTFLIPTLSEAAAIEITIKGIKNRKGNLRIGVFNNQESFENEVPLKTVVINKKKLSKGTIVHTLDLAPGTYGFAILDDENDNEEMDQSFFGLPLEGFGFSNYEHSGLFKPVFNDFKFFVKKGMTRVKMKLKYM